MKKELAERLLEKTKNDYNLIAGDFSRTRHNLWPELFTVFRDYTKDGDKVLDAGCGNGRLLDLISGKRIDYVGIDNSKEQVKEAQKKYPGKNFLTADILNLPFPDNSFDRIFSVAVLHHLPGKELRQKALRELKRVLKPAGFLLLTVWQPMFFEAFKLLSKYTLLKLIGRSKMDFGDVLIPWGQKIQRYYHLFAKKEIEALIRNSGLKMVKSDIVKNQTGKRQNLYVIVEKKPALSLSMGPHSLTDKAQPSGG